jgi:integrase
MTDILSVTHAVSKRTPWNKGKIVGAKPPLRPKHVWSIRTKLQVEGRMRDLALVGTHSLRRTKATLIYRRTGNLRAVQLLLGHTKIESTVRYLGIEVDDALAIAEQVDV